LAEASARQASQGAKRHIISGFVAHDQAMALAIRFFLASLAGILFSVINEMAIDFKLMKL